MTTYGTNPRTGVRLEPGVAETSPDELESHLVAAASASSFGSASPARRAEVLRCLADALDAAGSSLVETAGRETGLTRERLGGELARTVKQLRFLGDVVLDGACLDVVADTDTAQMRTWLTAVGPVLVFAAGNFPLAFGVLGGDTASALAAGAPVVVKAHPSHPVASAQIIGLAQEALAGVGAPAGLLSMVMGDAQGIVTLQDPRIRACGFTGSTAGGRYLFDVASSRPDPIPFYGELGSVNPVAVTPGAVTARGSKLISEFLASVTGSAGQLCTKPNVLLLPRGHSLDEVLARVGDLEAQPMLNERIARAFTDDTAELARYDGVRRLAALVPRLPTDGAGSWCTPALYRASTTWAREHRDLVDREYFGPAALVVEYDDVDDLVESLDLFTGSLTGTVHAEPHEATLASRLVRRFESRVGRIIYNGWPTGVVVGWATHHGGPWPASTTAHASSVGAAAIRRWMRPVCYQGVPDHLLPEGLRDDDPWVLPRRVDGTQR